MHAATFFADEVQYSATSTSSRMDASNNGRRNAFAAQVVAAIKLVTLRAKSGVAS